MSPRTTHDTPGACQKPRPLSERLLHAAIVAVVTAAALSATVAVSLTRGTP
jgi:hypothetical protein